MNVSVIQRPLVRPSPVVPSQPRWAELGAAVCTSRQDAACATRLAFLQQQEEGAWGLFLGGHRYQEHFPSQQGFSLTLLTGDTQPWCPRPASTSGSGSTWGQATGVYFSVALPAPETLPGRETGGTGFEVSGCGSVGVHRQLKRSPSSNSSAVASVRTDNWPTASLRKLLCHSKARSRGGKGRQLPAETIPPKVLWVFLMRKSLP